MKFAWIENGEVKDICPGTPSHLYTAEIAAHYTTQIGDDIVRGATQVNGVWVNPAPLVVAPMPKEWKAEDIRAGLTLAEKVKWDNEIAPEIKTVKAELPKEREGVMELLDFLVESGVISQASANKILG